jgi:hypothetical protein
MSSAPAPFHPTHTTGSWEDFETRVGGAAPALALFALACVPLLWLDVSLRESTHAMALLKPSAGLLFIALWMSRPSRWPALVLIHVLIALAMSASISMPATARDVLPDIVPVPICAIFGAVATMLLIRVPIQLAIWQVPRAIIGGVLGGLAGSLSTLLLRDWNGPAGPSYTYDLLSEWASLGLGAVTLGQLTLMWLLKIRVGVPELLLRSKRTLLGITAWVVMAALIGMVFLREHRRSRAGIRLLSPAATLGPDSVDAVRTGVRRDRDSS